MHATYMYVSHDVDDLYIEFFFIVVSVAFKFHVERGAGPREAVDYWKDNLTCVSSPMHMSVYIFLSYSFFSKYIHRLLYSVHVFT